MLPIPSQHDRVSRPSIWSPVALLLTALALPATPARGLWVRLSSGHPFSDVASPPPAPYSTSRWAIFDHDADVDDAYEVWSVPSFGGTQQRISGLLPTGAWARQFKVDASGSRVVYTAPLDTPFVDELYTVPVAGGATVKLNPDLPPGRNVLSFSISPDGQRVVYRADQDNASVLELYSVPIAGGTALKISGTLVTGGNVNSFAISGDSQRVVFNGDRLVYGVNEVFSVPIGGGTITRLNGPIAGFGVNSYSITPDSQRVVYIAQQDTAGVTELYSVPIGGGANVKLNGPLVAGGDVDYYYAVSPDSQRVLYGADQVTAGRFELFSAPITGGGAVKLNGALVTGGNVAQWTYVFSPDSQRAVYLADQQTLGRLELYSVPATGGLAVKLNGTLVAGGNVTDFQISPTSQWVVYRADQTVAGLPVGVRVPLAGPATSGQFVWQGPVTYSGDYWQITPDGQSIVVRGNAAFVDGIVRLWRFPLEGTLNPTGTELVPAAAFQPDGDVTWFGIGADGAILYVADQLSDQVYELFTIPVAVFWDGFEPGNTSAWSSAVP